MKIFDFDEIHNKEEFEKKVITYIKTNMYDKENINKFNSTINCANFLVSQAFDIELVDKQKENKFILMMNYINEDESLNEYLKLRSMLNYVTLINNVHEFYLYGFDLSFTISTVLNKSKLKKLEEISKIIGNKYVIENIKNNNIDFNQLQKIVKKLNAIDTSLENRYDNIIFILDEINNKAKQKRK